MSGFPLFERGLVRGGGRERRVNVRPTGAYVLTFLIVSHLEDDRRLTDGPRPNEAGVMGGRSAKLERREGNRGSERGSERGQGRSGRARAFKNVGEQEYVLGVGSWAGHSDELCQRKIGQSTEYRRVER